MQDVFRNVLYAISLTTFVVYFTGSFILWDFLWLESINEWQNMERALLALFYISFTISFLFIFFISKKISK